MHVKSKLYDFHVWKRLFRSFRSKICPYRSLRRPGIPKVGKYLFYRDTFPSDLAIRRNSVNTVSGLKTAATVVFSDHDFGTAKSRIWGAETPKPIAKKFYMMDTVPDLITHANFGEDWLRGFRVARDRNLAFSIDLLLRLYNTLALSCECLMRMTKHTGQITVTSAG